MAGLASHNGDAPQPMRAALEVEPYGHTRQCTDPDADAKEPTVQRTQQNPPGRDLAKPGRQWRIVLPNAPALPTISTPALGAAADNGVGSIRLEPCGLRSVCD